MYSSKKNVLLLAAMLEAYSIREVVLCPGSRNSPLIQTFSQNPLFRCFTVVDERSAGFFALGLSQELQQPVAVCCTSGTALLNLAPAVAEAYYQQVPLLVISADRPQAWIGQMDGQTLPQPGVFNSLVKHSVQLPDPISEEEEWYSKRLMHEAITQLTYHVPGPTHINIPLAEPLFDFTATELPVIKPILRDGPYSSLKNNILLKEWNEHKKRMILVGQLPPFNGLQQALEQLAAKFDCVIFAEHTANIPSSSVIYNYDAILYQLLNEEIVCFSPDLLITLGGHIVSKRIKKFLRSHPPKAHWCISEDNKIVDLFQCLTAQLEMDPLSFIEELLKKCPDTGEKHIYQSRWEKQTQRVKPPIDIVFSDLWAIGNLFSSLPAKAALQLGNSSTVRNAQLFPLDPSIAVYCNRGTSGIEGSVSTAVGFAAIHKGLTFLVVGDLSFFYDINGIWNRHTRNNLRILLINNGGGEIFHLLPGLNKASSLDTYVCCRHNTRAGEWAEAMGFDYYVATNEDEFSANLPLFVSNTSIRPLLFEIITSMEVNAEVFKTYYHHLKTI